MTDTTTRTGDDSEPFDGRITESGVRCGGAVVGWGFVAAYLTAGLAILLSAGLFFGETLIELIRVFWGI